MGDLFSSLPDAEHRRDIAWVGYYDRNTGLAQGFAEAAEAVFAAWQSTPWPDDPLLLPLVYNYRHALELALKQAIRQAAARLRFAGDDDPILAPEALEGHFKQKQRHRLDPLAKQLADMLKKLDLDELPPDTMRLLARLHQLDPTGEAFRYADRLKTDAHQVDVGQLTQLFRDAFNIIHGGVLTVLDQYADYQYEMWEENHRYTEDAYGF
jgi:hypothetical protein